MESIKELLAETPLSDLVVPTRVISLRHNITVGDALQTLANHRVLSAPMVLEPDLEDMMGEGVGSTQVIGWVDAQGILAAFLAHLRRRQESQEAPVGMAALMMALELEGPIFAEKPLITILSQEDREYLYAGDSTTTTVADAICTHFLHRLPSGDERINHRIALFDAHGEITAIISQMDVIRWVVQHADRLGRVASASIFDCGLLQGKRKVLTVSPIEPTIMAFDSMTKSNVSGAPVVTETNEAIANLSVSDLRAITAQHFGVLALPVAEFIALEHGVQFVGYEATGGSTSAHPFFARPGRHGKHANEHVGIGILTITPAAKFINVLRKFVDAHVHRLYVVASDENRKLEAVLTLTDVLRFLAGSC
jgi:5'-AMP-activated protein kinase, regulatory gamma subunit